MARSYNNINRPPEIWFFIDGRNMYHGMRGELGREINLGKLQIEKLLSNLADEKDFGITLVDSAEIPRGDDWSRCEAQYEFHQKIRGMENTEVILTGSRMDGKYQRAQGDDEVLILQMKKFGNRHPTKKAILISGDADLIPGVRALRSEDVKVGNIYLPCATSQKLRNACVWSRPLNKETLECHFSTDF